MSADDPFIGWHLEDPQSLNLYSYVQDNPLNFTDPTGHVAPNIGKHVTCTSEGANNGAGGGGGVNICTTGAGLPGGDAAPGGALNAKFSGQALTPEELADIKEMTEGKSASAKPKVSGFSDLPISPEYQPNGGKETMGQIAGRVLGETGGMKDSSKQNEPLQKAQEKIAHVRLNGIKRWGDDVQTHASLAAPVMHGAGYVVSFLAVENAVRENLKSIDPTSGATFYNMRTPKQAAGMGKFQGQNVHTVSGPYVSPSRYTYIVTYGP